ncbi:MAG TPA: homogentisate 1,2-dioxygenase [Planctomycetota bacterium]|nr:homogentisate 1,2-dioxygenase [Planctomycetota bacterium]
MPSYMHFGDVPKKRHIKLHREPGSSFKGEGICYEHVVTTAGFNRAYSIMYHLRPPTRVRAIEVAGSVEIEKVHGRALQHTHIKTASMPRSGDPVSGRVPILTNPDVTCYRCRPAEAQKVLFRNGTADEVIFVFHGGGVMESSYGKLPYREGDYIVIPRGTTYRLVPKDISAEDYMILEADGAVRVPRHYMNRDGQIKMGAPYSERDLHGPRELLTIDQPTDTEVIVKDHNRLTRYVHASHPFDVVGWDGFIYPYTFNVEDFEPITGTVHQPPPIHQTFEVKGFVICTFAPRMLDTHPEAIKVPYVHSNVEADEVLFYVKGNFGSRKGVESGSFTLYPRGIPHGPHPGTIMASMKASRTEELAVMFDTDRPLFLTPQALKLEDPAYPFSWIDKGE